MNAKLLLTILILALQSHQALAVLAKLSLREQLREADLVLIGRIDPGAKPTDSINGKVLGVTRYFWDSTLQVRRVLKGSVKEESIHIYFLEIDRLPAEKPYQAGTEVIWILNWVDENWLHLGLSGSYLAGGLRPYVAIDMEDEVQELLKESKKTDAAKGSDRPGLK